MGRFARLVRLGVCGDVRVELETDASLRPGDAVVGTVVLRTHTPIPSAQLRVAIRGKQTLRWWINIDEIRILHWRKLQHLDHTIPLVDHDAMFLPGELRYPFTFQLPTSDLPPSLQFKRGRVANLEDVRAKINYAVDATLVVDALTTADLRASAAFAVSPPTLCPVPKPVAAETDALVKFLWGLRKRGSCRLSLQLASDVVNSASVIEAVATIEVDTPCRLKYVKLALYQDATIDRHTSCCFFPHGLKRGSRAIISRRFSPAALGIGAHDKTKAVLHLPLTTLDKPKCDVLSPTLAAHFISLHYHVALECHFAFARTARVCVPVTIVASKAL